MMKCKHWIVFVVLFSASIAKPLLAQEIYDLKSPNGKILTHIRFSDKIDFEVLFDSVPIVRHSTIAMNVGEDFIMGKNPKVTKKITNSVDRELSPIVPLKSKVIRDNFNEAIFKCKGKYNIVFRVYDNGLAWRFETSFKDDIKVNSETLDLNFPENSKIWFPEEERFISHNERYYLHENLSDISEDRFCSLPALVESADNIKVLITETDLEDYPGMWLKGTGSNSLNAIFPGVALEVNMTNDRNPDIAKYADYIAKTNGNRTFPWRILAIAENDADLIMNQLSYQLAKPNVIEDPSWIKPGKVSWDWWNAWNIYGVDFEAGVNTETYRYYIDFASEFGIEYIIMDEGWYVLGDLMDVVPEIDMEEIISYAGEKNVDVILWVIWKTLEDQWEEAFDQFEKWGVKGLKVDFMQRDDQWMVDYYYRVAEEAAKRKMLVDFHGAYKPAGLRRKYPNVITREGLRGLEQNKWSKTQTPEHNVTLPFIRMVAGPIDYTPGAMVNAQPDNFNAVWNRPMSQGTRCHQLAMYVVFESPLQMLADNPSNYYKEAECMEFLSVVPSVWDTTIVLSAKIADHILIARKKGDEWFVGGMTNGGPKDLKVDFSFLGTGNHKIDIWQDGINANRYASDYKKISTDISAKDTMKIHLAPGGGWAARIY
jgi:alpha-glucosidase